MSTEPTKEKVLKLLKRKGLNNLITELENDPECLEDWKQRTESQWKEFYQLAGVDIYNCLHPPSEGIIFLILGVRVLPRIQIDTDQMTDIDSNELIDPWGDKNAVWVGKRDSRTGNEGIDLKETKIVKRTATIQTLLAQLEKTKILLIKSPPMTGKTSMATLIADSLHLKNSCNQFINGGLCAKGNGLEV